MNIFLQSSCRLNISGMEEEYKNYDFINSTTNLKKSGHCQKTTLVYQQWRRASCKDKDFMLSSSRLTIPQMAEIYNDKVKRNSLRWNERQRNKTLGSNWHNCSFSDWINFWNIYFEKLIWKMSVKGLFKHNYSSFP